MRLFIALLISLIAFAPLYAADSNIQRAFKNENIGNVSLQAPENWEPIERHHINYGTTFYRLKPPSEGLFDFEILVNDLDHMGMKALVPKDLERYLQYTMSSFLAQSVEGKTTPIRFGHAKDGVYATLTDKAPKPGEFALLTQGVRLQGNKVVLFTLYSNKQDSSVLKKALAVVDSIQFEQ